MSLNDVCNDIIACKKCELSENLQLYPMPGFYTDINRVKLFIIGINPGQPQPNENVLLKELNNDYKKHYEIGLKKCRIGHFLDDVLKSLEIGWNEIFFTNIIKCSTPDNRMPTKEEITSCLNYLKLQKGFVKLTNILLLGKFVAQAMGFDNKPPFAIKYDNINYYCVHHPSYLVRTGTTNKAVKFIKEKYGII